MTKDNHEIERIPMIENSFKAYDTGRHIPYELSNSTSDLYYSFDVAGDSTHVIMLGSYMNFDSDSDQCKRLVGNLAKVDKRTAMEDLLYPCRCFCWSYARL